MLNFDDPFEIATSMSAIKVRERDWFSQFKFKLVTANTLPEVIDHLIANSTHVAIDLEGTGLDTRVKNGKTVDQIVGVCLSGDGETGYYIPLLHGMVGRINEDYAKHNIGLAFFSTHFKRLLEAIRSGKIKAIFHGPKYDQEMLEFNTFGEDWGHWDEIKNWEATDIILYLLRSDPEIVPKGQSKLPSLRLKDLTRTLLGFDQMKLEELFPEGTVHLDFSTLDPSQLPVLQYAACDAIFTWLLHHRHYPRVMATQKSIYQIEKLNLLATRWMERCRIHIDKAKLEELIRIGHKEWFEAVRDVYASISEILHRDICPPHFKFFLDHFDSTKLPYVKGDKLYGKIKSDLKKAIDKVKGNLQYTSPETFVVKGDTKYPYVYDIESPEQLGLLFQELEVPGLQYTEKSKQVQTSKDMLDEYVSGAADQFPFMDKIRFFREVSKALSTFLYPIYLGLDPEDNTVKVSFNPYRADTGRFATPASEKDQDSDDVFLVGHPKWNFQSTPAGYDDPKRPRPKCMSRIREIVASRPGKLIAAPDYSGVELRIVTNLSREPKWLDAYFKCSACNYSFDRGTDGNTPKPPPPRCPSCGSDKIGDLHTLTAIQIYGEDAPTRPDWKVNRQNGKRLNFAMVYGGGGSAAMRAVACDKNEGWRIKREYDKAYPVLQGWWSKQHAACAKDLYVTTIFGRRLYYPDIKHELSGFRAQAERNATNGPIQGSSADITKLAMGLIYKEVRKRKWEQKVFLVGTMHDELIFEIDVDILEEALEVIKSLMLRNELLLSRKWPVPLTSDVEIGYSWAVPWNLDAMRQGEVRYHNGKKLKSKEDAAKLGLNWEGLPSFPPDLAPYFKYQNWESYMQSPWGDSMQSPILEGHHKAPVEISQATASHVIEMESAPPPVTVKKAGTVTHTLLCPLNMKSMQKVAAVLQSYWGKGQNTLVLKDFRGSPITLDQNGKYPDYIADVLSVHLK